MTLEGIFGVPLDVAATYIILFSIYGAMLTASGAGTFFLDWSMAAVGKSGGGARAGPRRHRRRAAARHGVGERRGQHRHARVGGVADAEARAATRRTMGGAILSAAGIGAIICPPALGAAAFIIAEFLHITYLQVIVMAAIPALLYFFSIFLMIEADTRRAGARPVDDRTPPSLWQLTRRHGYHFLALVGIPIMLVMGMSAFRAVFYSMIDRRRAELRRSRERARGRDGCFEALHAAARSVLPVAATTATAGIIVGTVTLTGLGLKIAGLIVALAGGHALPDGALFGARGLDARTGRARHRVVHHRGRHGRAGDDPGRRAGRRGAHVHLLLRRALGGEPADGALAVCRGRDHRRAAVSDDDAAPGSTRCRRSSSRSRSR